MVESLKLPKDSMLGASIVTITGNTAIERGTYEAKISLKSPDYVWEDSTANPVVLEWKILLERTFPSLSASEDSIKIGRASCRERV